MKFGCQAGPVASAQIVVLAICMSYCQGAISTARIRKETSAYTSWHKQIGAQDSEAKGQVVLHPLGAIVHDCGHQTFVVTAEIEMYSAICIQVILWLLAERDCIILSKHQGVDIVSKKSLKMSASCSIGAMPRRLCTMHATSKLVASVKWRLTHREGWS